MVLLTQSPSTGVAALSRPQPFLSHSLFSVRVLNARKPCLTALRIWSHSTGEGSGAVTWSVAGVTFEAAMRSSHWTAIEQRPVLAAGEELVLGADVEAQRSRTRPGERLDHLFEERCDYIRRFGRGGTGGGL